MSYELQEIFRYKTNFNSSPLGRLGWALLAFLCFSFAAAADFSGGYGTRTNPWQIRTATELNNVRNYNGSEQDLKYFKLMNDIDLRDLGETNNWTPINTSGVFMDFDGNSYMIKNLHISTTSSSPNYQSFAGGLFGRIRNLGLVNVYIEAPNTGAAGAFTGYVGAANPAFSPERTGIIENCFASGYVSSGGGAVGGITGFIGRPAHDGTLSHIRNCYFSGEVYNTYDGSSQTVYTGGIAGSVRANENIIANTFDTLNIVTYNVYHFGGNVAYPDGNYQVIANVLKSLKPDVVCIQELDSVTTRTNRVYQLKRLADLNSWNYRFASNIPYRGGSYGIGITTPHAIVKSSSYKLTSSDEQRGFLIVEFAKYVMVCTHLDLDATVQTTQVQEITKKVKELYGSSSKPVFLGGDLNSLPSSNTMKEFYKDWTMLSPQESTSPKANKCIDYILMLNKGDKYKVLDARVIRTSEFGDMPNESDHFPVMVTVIVP